MIINFYKMEGIGNDFILLDSRNSGFAPDKKQVVRWCDRRFGIGADGVLVLLKPKSPDAGFRMRILNSDGSEAEMCGNGIRALARYIYDHKLASGESIAVETVAGLREVERKGELFRVMMGRPEFAPDKVPVKSRKPLIGQKLKVAGVEFKVTCVSLGNPHCVIVVKDAAKIALRELGPRIENHPLFPKKTNVEFVQVLSARRLKVRVWERGAGETLACGTGACAVLAACATQGLSERKARVSLPGGDLTVEWKDQCYLTGPARTVYQGWIDTAKF